MSTLALLFALSVISVLPGGLAGPACTRKYYGASDCVQKCGSKWGYPGYMMGSNPWGMVFQTTDISTAAWDAVIAKACGVPRYAEPDLDS